jgi:OmpA-OmpF porin, OOP family
LKNDTLSLKYYLNSQINMKQKFSYLIAAFFLPMLVAAQTVSPTPANLPKDAQVDVFISDLTSNNPLSNEIVVFKSEANGTEFQGLSDSTGKFSVRLPSGSKYDVFILGFHDSTSYNILDIPALAPNHFYGKPFKENIQFQPAKAFVLENCNFETGKANLQPESYKVLDELVEFMQRKQDEKIEIGGHTDDVGSDESNLKLSLDRANTVRAYLLTKGIAPDRVTAKGYGATMPIADNGTAEGRAQNRRTEVTVL